MFKLVVIAILVAAYGVVGIASNPIGSEPSTHYPKLIRAELPLYPSIARTANISGTVELQVTIERGIVVDVKVMSPIIPYLTKPTIANINSWQFESSESATFLVKYVYEIKGKQTPQPENPRLELDLPRLLRITTRPFKPTTTRLMLTNRKSNRS